jgi:hypothetical protein
MQQVCDSQCSTEFQSLLDIGLWRGDARVSTEADAAALSYGPGAQSEGRNLVLPGDIDTSGYLHTAFRHLAHRADARNELATGFVVTLGSR